MVEFTIEQGDLTEWQGDAIVNAANNDLVLGGGLAGMIARKGGPTIQEECNRLGPIMIGEAALTAAGNLPVRYVIHAASMALGGRTTAGSLESSVQACLRIAREHRLRSIAFPAIGTGIAGFPVDQCARIMVRILWELAGKKTGLEKISIVLWDTPTYNSFLREYNSMKEDGTERKV